VSPPVVSLDDVSLRLGEVWALRGLSLRIHAGERVALVGANGSGKSSLLRLLLGGVSPSAGHRVQAAGGRPAMLFQRPFLMRMSVRLNVALALWLAGSSWSQAREAAMKVLAHTGLADLAQRRATALSGGQQQRVALARVWALQPGVLLLDEPTASLDPQATREFERLVQRLVEAPGPDSPTLVFASHHLGQVRRLAHRVVYLEKGRIVADLPVNDFFNDARLGAHSPQAQAFVRGEIP
jgi:tungstate transport system ATP-binding protein